MRYLRVAVLNRYWWRKVKESFALERKIHMKLSLFCFFYTFFKLSPIKSMFELKKHGASEHKHLIA